MRLLMIIIVCIGLSYLLYKLCTWDDSAREPNYHLQPSMETYNRVEEDRDIQSNDKCFLNCLRNVCKVRSDCILFGDCSEAERTKMSLCDYCGESKTRDMYLKNWV